MSITLVQSKQSSSTTHVLTGAGDSFSCTGNWNSNTTAGNFLVAIMYVQASSGPSSTFSIATSGISWTSLAVCSATTGGANKLAQIFYSQNASSVSSGTNTTFTCTQNSGGGGATVTIEASLYEFSGVLQVGSPVRGQTQRNNQVTSVPFTSHIFSTPESDLIVAACVGTTSLSSVGSGFTLGLTTAAVAFGTGQYMLGTSGSTVDITFSGTSQALWGATSVGFKSAPSTATGTTYGFFFGD